MIPEDVAPERPFSDVPDKPVTPQNPQVSPPVDEAPERPFSDLPAEPSKAPEQPMYQP